MNKKKFRLKVNRSDLSQRLLVQYLLSIALYLIGLVLLILLGVIIGSSFIWQEDDLLYRIMIYIRNYIFYFYSFFALVGWIFITYYFISKPLNYLDEVVKASSQLALVSEEALHLSPELSNVENELNLVREKAIRNAEAAEAAEKRKNDMIVYLAHDLKTPLTSVIGYLTLLRDEKEISEELRQKYLSISLGKAEHLEELVNEFFDITRFNLSSISLQQSEVNLTRLLEQVLFEFRPMFEEKNLKCTFHAPQDVMVYGDSNKLQRVFDNLLRNAVFYSFRDTAIYLSVKQSENTINIQIVNRGERIPEEKLERIFEEFFRLDAARTTNQGGAGLGLAIAKRILDLHGGSIRVSSEGNLIEFVVSLPRP